MTLGLVMTRYEMSLLIGDAFSAGPIASILSPFVLGMLVDRFFRLAEGDGGDATWPGRRSCGLSRSAGGAERRPADWPAVRLYAVLYATLALTNNIAFHSLANVDKTFPVVRVFGTIGWIIAGICIG